MKSWPNIRRGLVMLRNIFWKVGVLGDYRRVFWKFALGRIKRGDLEGLIGCTLIAHHLITFARAASSGRQNASTIRSACVRPPFPPNDATCDPAGAAARAPRSAVAYACARRARSRRRERADKGLAGFHAGPCPRPRCRACSFRRAASGRGSPRAWPRRHRGPEPGGRPQGIFAAAGSGTTARAGSRSFWRECSEPCQLAIVIGDGLSAAAINAHAVALVARLMPRLADGRKSKSAMPWSLQVRGSRSATRSAPFSVRAWW